MLSEYKIKEQEKKQARRERLLEFIGKNPMCTKREISRKMDVSIASIDKDVRVLSREGHEEVIIWRNNGVKKQAETVERRKKVKKLFEDHPYINRVEAAELLGVPYSTLDWDLQHIKKKLGNKSIKKCNTYNMQFAEIAKTGKISEYLSIHPEATYEDIKRDLGYSVRAISHVFDILKKRFSEEIVSNYAVYVQNRIKDLQERIDFCDTQLQKSVKKDPRTGSRWMEESRKLIDMMNKLLDLYPKNSPLIQQNNVIINDEQKNAIDNLFKDMQQGLFSHNAPTLTANKEETIDAEFESSE